MGMEMWDGMFPKAPGADTGKPQALEGIRVVDWTTAQAGPAATMLLADLGAAVIKIEAPSTGESFRGADNVAGFDLTLPHGHSYSFEVYNRNKKSMAVDIRTDKGREIIHALVKISDVFVQNYSVGTAKRNRIDYNSLRPSNEQLIYANCSGYGPVGPRTTSPAMDPAVHAASGIMMAIGEPGMPPIHLTGAIADMTTSLSLAFGISTALLARERTGVGQEINVSMLNARMWVQTNNLLYTLKSGAPHPRQAQASAPNPLVNYYRCKDDKWILMAHFRADKYWPTLCSAMNLEPLLDDERFKDNASRRQNCEALIGILDGRFAEKTRAEWMAILDNKELVVSPIQDYMELLNDEQVALNRFMVEYDHPVLGNLVEPGFPVDFTETPGSIRSPAPQAGQHTEELLVDLLGYTWDDIRELYEQGVIP